MSKRDATNEQTAIELARYAPALAARNGQLPELELAAHEVSLTDEGVRITIVYHDVANDSLLCFGPFDPSEVSGERVARVCELKARATFN